MLKTDRITLYGIVIPIDWLQDGEISAVGIAGYDETVYRVINASTGIGLRFYLQKRVVVDGVIQRLGETMTIHVLNYRIDTSDPTRPHNT